jgi:single-strand DNA-binding protein
LIHILRVPLFALFRRWHGLKERPPHRRAQQQTGEIMSRDVASVTIVGRAGTHPQLSVGLTGDRVSFRVVATERRFDRTADDWVDGDEFGVTVVCWRTMAAAVLNVVRKGDPVVIVGRISTRRFERDGVTQYFTEVKADFVGLDVARAGTRFTRNPMEPRPAEEPTGLPAGSDQAGSASPPDGDPATREAEEFRAQWEAENDAGDGRTEELVSVD